MAIHKEPERSSSNARDECWPREWQRLVTKAARTAVQRIYTGLRRDPQRASLIFEQGEDGIAREARRNVRVVAKSGDAPRSGIEPREALVT